MRYQRISFFIQWYIEGAKTYTGEYEITGMTEEEIANMVHFNSPDDLRPDAKDMSLEGVLSFGMKFGIPVDPKKYVYQIEEIGFLA